MTWLSIPIAYANIQTFNATLHKELYLQTNKKKETPIALEERPTKTEKNLYKKNK